jgi:hypothetical protein
MSQRRNEPPNITRLSTTSPADGKSRGGIKHKAPNGPTNDNRASVRLLPRSLTLAASHYDGLLEHLTRCEFGQDDNSGSDLRQCVSDAALDQLRSEFPQAPADYVEYLQVVGWGSLLRGRYNVYERLVPAVERLGAAHSQRLGQTVLCFGDNLAGDIGGFLPDQDWELVEVSHLSGAIEPIGVPFSEFIGDRLGFVS